MLKFFYDSKVFVVKNKIKRYQKQLKKHEKNYERIGHYFVSWNVFWKIHDTIPE